MSDSLLQQILKLMETVNIQHLINKHRSDYYYKTLSARIHLITIPVGILSCCASMKKIGEGLLALGRSTSEKHGR